MRTETNLSNNQHALLNEALDMLVSDAARFLKMQQNSSDPETADCPYWENELKKSEELKALINKCHTITVIS